LSGTLLPVRDLSGPRADEITIDGGQIGGNELLVDGARER
jgi:hypothetical protein